MRLRLLSFTVLGAIVLLAGCARLSLLPRVDISVVLDPPALTYTVNQQGEITSGPNVVTFISRPGSLGATISSYRVHFYDASGNSLIEGGSTFHSDMLAVIVPAGIQCDMPDANGSCSINDPGARFAARAAEPVTDFIALPLPIAAAHLAGSPVGARAEIHFFGIDDNGREFSLNPVRVPLLRVGN